MLQTLSVDGNSDSIQTSDKVHVHVSGTFGGGTAKAQFKDEGGTWRDIAGASWTAAADQLIELGNMSQYDIRVNLAGATTPSLVVIIRG